MTEPFQAHVSPAVDAAADEPPLPVVPERGVSAAETRVAAEQAPVVETPSDAESEVDALAAADESSPSADDDLLLELKDAVTRLSSGVEKYHQRAAHREVVIDHLHEELEKLRASERRSTIRPVLLAVARLRDDLLRQGRDLPADFDAARAQRLLQSFADSIEITLDDFGISVHTPEVGEAFEPRRHKAVAATPTDEATLVRTIAGVRRDGYLDVEAAVTLSQAEVAVYVDGPTQARVTSEPPSVYPGDSTEASVKAAADETPTVEATTPGDPSTGTPLE